MPEEKYLIAIMALEIKKMHCRVVDHASRSMCHHHGTRCLCYCLKDRGVNLLGSLTCWFVLSGEEVMVHEDELPGQEDIRTLLDGTKLRERWRT